MQSKQTPRAPASSSGHDASRRTFLGASAGLLATGLSLGGTASRAQSGPTAETLARSAFTGSHVPVPLPFEPASLDGLSRQLIESHWANNYGGSVKTLNAVKERLARAVGDSNFAPFEYNALKREHLMRTGSVILHELYFANLGGDGRAGTGLQRQIGESFGDFATWESEFNRIALGLGGGSGWVILAYNTHFHSLENYWLADHMHYPASSVPLLVLDMYEHSYQLDYGAATARYIDAFFRNIQWDEVASRFESLGLTA